MNLLRESNVVLRDELERTVKQLRQVETQRKSLEESIAPLQGTKHTHATHTLTHVHTSIFLFPRTHILILRYRASLSPSLSSHLSLSFLISPDFFSFLCS